MINAGLIINPRTPNVIYESSTNTWKGVGVRVNYPPTLTMTTNPILEEDLIIEPTGHIWLVTRSLVGVDNQFTVDLKFIGFDNSLTVEPGFDITSKGSVVTPINKMVSPYWDTEFVDEKVHRIASQYNSLQVGNFFPRNIHYGEVEPVGLKDGDIWLKPFN